MKPDTRPYTGRNIFGFACPKGAFADISPKAQPAPGPWTVDATPAHAPCSFIIRHQSRTCAALVPVATVSASEGDTMATACLIAAAPELLAALEMFMAEYAVGIGNDREQRPEIIAARAAIFKAKGTQ